MLESQLQGELLRWLKRKSIEHWRMPIGPVLHAGGKTWGKNPLKGFPDIMGILKRGHPGRAWAVEIKVGRAALRPEQVDWIKRLSTAGAAVAIVRSIADAEDFFRSLGEIT